MTDTLLLQPHSPSPAQLILFSLDHDGGALFLQGHNPRSICRAVWRSDCITSRRPVQVQRADAEFTEWLWCRGPDEKEGWVHRSFLSHSSGRAVAVADYSAKELTVAAGEQARIIRVLDGWAFVELDGSEVGWVPERVLETSTSNPYKAE
jgi:hypothetical protein